MKLKKFGALLLTGVLAITSLTTSAFAAKREKRSADDIDFAAVLEDTSAKGTVNVYHWWTAGGEKDAIESVIDEFKGAYGKVKTKSNAIPGGAGGRQGRSGTRRRAFSPPAGRRCPRTRPM